METQVFQVVAIVVDLPYSHGFATVVSCVECVGGGDANVEC